MRIFAPPGVYRPRFDTKMLIDAVRGQPLPEGARVLELCTGSGAVSIDLAERGCDVTAVDLGRRAAWAARINARLNRQRIVVRRGDLFAAVSGQTFDVIVANPPYVPSPDHERAEGAARAWNAGADGRLVLDRICTQASAHLRPGGAVFIVQSSLADVEATEAQLAESGLDVDVVRSSRGPLGPIAAARADFLAASGLDADAEDIVVVRGRRPARPATRRPAAPAPGRVGVAEARLDDADWRNDRASAA